MSDIKTIYIVLKLFRWSSMELHRFAMKPIGVDKLLDDKSIGFLRAFGTFDEAMIKADGDKNLVLVATIPNEEKP